MRTLFLFVLVLAPQLAFGEPLWNNSDCDSSFVYSQLSTGSANIVHYYIESDFADELKGCTPSQDDEMTEFHLRTHVKDTAETWNAESRAAFLRYAGTYTGTAESVCSSAEEPAIFVRFEKGCDDAGGSCASTTGSARKLAGCNSAAITIYGDPNTQDNCAGTLQRDWKLEEGSGDLSLRATLLHEFGHVLGLAHPNENSVPDVGSGSCGSTTTCETTMWSSYTITSDYKHLWPWEKDCVDNFWDGRQALARSLSHNSSGAAREDEYITTTYTEKGNLAGYPWRSSGTKYYVYSIVDPSADYRRAAVGSDGYLSWADSGYDWNNQPFDVNMTFTNILPGSSDRQYVYYGWNQTRDSDPTDLKGTYSTNMFSSKSYGYMYSYNGSSYDRLYSHVPASTAYDPVSGETIFVTVDTDRQSSDEGGIRIHPGVRSGYRYLEKPEYVHDNVSVPSDSYSNWSYDLGTYFGVGVACADSVPSGMNDHNCIVAWIDRGTPDNRVLYTWFKLNGTDVQFHDTTYVRAGTYALNHVTLGFFNDEIHMAYKTTGSGVDIAMTTNSLASYTSWDTVSYHGPNGWVVDPPTWAAVGSSNEATLMWTETPEWP